MPYIAVGTVREQSGMIGLRLIDIDTLRMADISMGEVSYYNSRNGGISNIAIDKKGNLQWKQGVAERYPIIDKMTNQIRNSDSVIVLGVADTGTNKYYRICNLEGKAAMVEAAQLINYGKEHKIANCKISKKAGKEFISSIGGEISEIQTKPTWKFNRDFGYMELYMPFITSDTLRIPEVTSDGVIIEGVTSFVIKPASSGYVIKKLILSKNIKDIKYGLFTSMPNLEEVEVLGEDVLVYDKAFIGLKKLKHVKFNTIKASGVEIFEGLKELESVTAKKQMPIIGTATFSGCKSLDINSVLTDGVIGIRSKAFFNCKKSQYINLPSTLRNIRHNAFDGCENLREINCLTSILNIEEYLAYKSLDTMRHFLEGIIRSDTPIKDVPRIKFYVKKNALIEGAIGRNVDVIRLEGTKDDKSLEKKIQKSNMIGLNLDPSKLVSSPKDISNILLATNQEDINRMIVELVDWLFKYKEMKYANKKFDLKGFKVSMQLARCKGFDRTKKIENLGKFLLLRGPRLVFIPLDRGILINHINRTRKSHSEGMIQPISVNAKYIKSIDILDNGCIRLIYQDTDGVISVNTLDQFEIKKSTK